MEALTISTYVEAARLRLVVGDFDGAAQLILNEMAANPIRVEKGLGIYYFEKIIPRMLQNGKMADVAHLLWGTELFDPRPYSVQKIWKALRDHDMSLIIGAGSLGKSWNTAAYFLLDWLADPMYTCVKVVSVNLSHAEKNIFALIKRLHESSIIPLPGERKAESLMASDNAEQGIHLVAIPPGMDGTGRLQGFHPKPRDKEHAVYGKLTRVRAVLDEAEEVAPGVWPDIDNMLITRDPSNSLVKVAGCANPRRRESSFGHRCEPISGWSSINIEDSHEWGNKFGWHITRIDGARCENVTERRVVFPGLLTYEGYISYVKKGVNDPNYLTMARGWFPEQGVDAFAIPSEIVDRSVGHLNFIHEVTYCGAVDLALEGVDKAIMTIAKFGLADGRTCLGQHTRFEGPKWGVQIEAQFEIPKYDPTKQLQQTIWIARQIKKHCKETFQILPMNLIVDRTGNGSGVHDTLKQEFGVEVVGLNFGTASTETKILEDDTQTAEELYDGVVTELFFATRKFMETDSLVISPSVSLNPLRKELSTRKWNYGRGGRNRVESKQEYANQGNDSPDRADSLCMIQQVIRKRKQFRASRVSKLVPQKNVEAFKSIVDSLEFKDMSHD